MLGLLEHFKENLIGLESTRLHFLSYSTSSINVDKGANFYYGFLHFIVFETKQKQICICIGLSHICTYNVHILCQIGVSYFYQEKKQIQLRNTFLTTFRKIERTFWQLFLQ
jgi:hypothetical protein